MPTTIEKYVSGCKEIVDAKPAYKNGASSLTECDCIGMDKYSFRKNGVKFSTSGTNYSARNQVNNLRVLHSASDLSVGDIVFKAREPGEIGYDLPAKYQPGGAQYNGDLRDYYHIGTVESVSPLRIIHMTSPTAKTDTKIGKWGFVAEWKKEYISDSPSPAPEPSPGPEPKPEPTTAMVYAENDFPVKMREKPSTSCKLYDLVPCGSIVEVLARDCSTDNAGNVWSQISYGMRTGWYMMSKFLLFKETFPADEAIPSGLVAVTIPNLTEEQANDLLAQYPGSFIVRG